MRRLLIAAIAVLTCAAAYPCDAVRSGGWAVELQNDQLQMMLLNGDTNRVSVAFDEPLASFRGLAKHDLVSSGANVRFELHRPAGVLAFEGRVAGGTGIGQYRFTPNRAFLRRMEARGYRDVSDALLLEIAAGPLFEHWDVDAALSRNFDRPLVAGIGVAHDARSRVRRQHAL